jgi:hypothetical protein
MRRIVGDHTLFAPRGCMVCTAGTGELLDFEIDFGPHGLRPYLCAIHMKEAAKAWGFIEGDEQDDLLRVRKTLVAKEQELSQAGTDIRALLATYQQQENLLAERTAQYEHERQRADQLQARLEQTIESIQATTDATRELVTVPASDPEQDFDEPALD